MAGSDSRVALVTGGASGIGKAIVVALAAEGHHVMIVDRDTDRGEEAASETGARFVQADLSTRDGCRAAVDATVESMGPVEILINNAGIQHIDSIEDFPEDIWDQMLSLMLTAPFLLTKHCWPGMRRTGWGRIVNIASIHGLVASPFKSAYISAKHGLIGLTKTAALEGGEYGITVNALCPAYTMTPMAEGQIADQARTLGIPENDVIEQVMLAPAAIKRPLDPSEVADLAAYLCSDRARGITGSSFTIDLGWTAR